MSETTPPFSASLATSICRGFQELRQEGELCDLEVVVGSTSFRCHHLLLASVSAFFRSLLSGAWREKQSGKVILEPDDVTPEAFQMLVDILYKAQDVVTMDTATDIIRMAIFLQVKFLEEYCVQYLSVHLTPERSAGVWMFAEKYQLPDLAHKACCMACEQSQVVVKGEEILHLPKSMLLILLASQKTLSMDDTCRTILRWVEEDIDARQICFEELLPFVSFPQLSPGYIYELMDYFNHPFFKHISRGIQEAVSFNLQGLTADLKRQILAKQDRISTSPLLTTCAVILGTGGNTSDTATKVTVTAFAVEPGTKFYSFTLKEPPEPFAPQCRTCVYRNELYVSQRDEQKTLLAKYVPGDNVWESLPPLEVGVEHFSMDALRDRIYLIGGKIQRQQRSGIPYYNVLTKAWCWTSSPLLVDVDDPATAVVGHRIYVLAGRGEGSPQDAVQCVDTRSDLVYRAGTLPPACGAVVALSDGGAIYLLCDGTLVLKMAEHFELADRKEKVLCDRDSSTEAEPREVAEDSDAASSVSFLRTGVFTEGRTVSAFLHSGQMVGCGSVTEDGVVCSDVRALALATGELTKKRLAFQTAGKNMALSMLNIPQEFLNEDTAVAHYQQGDPVRLKKTVAPPERYINNPYSNHRTVCSLSYGQMGTILSINADGTTTTQFDNFWDHTSSAHDLIFA